MFSLIIEIVSYCLFNILFRKYIDGNADY